MDDRKHFYFNANGSRFMAGAIQPSDREWFQQGFSELSERSRYLRFFAVDNRLSEYQLKYFTDVDGINHVAWGILDVSGPEPKPVGVGRFVRLKDEPEVAEVAITIIDAYQRSGLGSTLFAILNIIAAEVGVKRLRYYVLKENRFVVELIKQMGIEKEEREGHAFLVDTKVFADYNAIAAQPGMEAFVSTMKETANWMGKANPQDLSS